MKNVGGEIVLEKQALVLYNTTKLPEMSFMTHLHRAVDTETRVVITYINSVLMLVSSRLVNVQIKI